LSKYELVAPEQMPLPPPGVMTRRLFSQRALAGLAGGSALAGVLAACGNQSSPSSAAPSGSGAAAKTGAPLAMQSSWVPDAEFTGYFEGLRGGYYKKVGLDYQFIPGGSSISPESIVIEGKAQLALSEPDLTASIAAKGAKFKIIGAQFQKNPIGIMSLPKSNIHGPHDLIGKKVGVPSVNQLTIQALFKVNGINPGDVHILPYSFDPTPVANGDLDAAIAFVTTDPYLLLAKGIKTNTFLLADYGVELYNDAIVVTEDTLKNRRADLVKFIKASSAAWNTVMTDTANRKKYVDLVTQDFGKSLGDSYSSQLFQLESEFPLMTSPVTKAKGLYWMDQAGINANLKTIELLKIKAPPNLFDTSVLEEAYANGPHPTL
jgi:ABC-type nitrate/sulfonate/bicarbonate transport system substrate-binding protein